MKIDSRIDMPLVSLILVVRNERTTVERALESIIRQSYPRYLIEILLVDGFSDDGTAEYLKEQTSRLNHEGRIVKFLSNPSRKLASGWNIALRAASSDLVCRIDAHSEIASDYILRGIEELMKMKRDKIGAMGGVIMNNIGLSLMGRLVGMLSSSRFGVGNSPFRVWKDCIIESDTAAYALYWKDAIYEAGLFRESMNRNQDLDLHYRMRKLGWRIITNPHMHITYYVRNEYRKWIKKTFSDGFYIGRMGRSAFRHRVPFYFILYLFWLPIGVWFIGGWAFIPLVVYMALSIYYSLKDGRGKIAKIILPLFFFSFHFVYGLASAFGLASRLLRGRQKSVEYHSV